MPKDEKVNIKLEVCRDKTSGKLSIIAHFNSNAPNIYQQKDGYYWMPTSEEKDLLNEAFDLMPVDGGIITTEKPSPKTEIKEEKPEIEPVIEEEIKVTAGTNSDEEKTKTVDLPPLERSNDKDIFEVTDEQIKKDDMKKDIDKKIEEESEKIDEKNIEEPASDNEEPDKKEEDERIIVEADNEAIENALKKRTEKDKTIVEADEQTIIDKVLSQKKKGRWSKH